MQGDSTGKFCKLAVANFLHFTTAQLQERRATFSKLTVNSAKHFIYWNCFALCISHLPHLLLVYIEQFCADRNRIYLASMCRRMHWLKYCEVFTSHLTHLIVKSLQAIDSIGIDWQNQTNKILQYAKNSKTNRYNCSSQTNNTKCKLQSYKTMASSSFTTSGQKM